MQGQGENHEGWRSTMMRLAAIMRWRAYTVRARIPRAAGAYVVVGIIAALGVWSGLSAEARLDDGVIRTGTAADFLREDKIRLYAAHQADQFFLPSTSQIKRFSEALQALRDYEARVDPRLLVRARGLLRSVNYGLVNTTDGYWYLRDRRPERGWGSYVLNRAPRSRLTVEVPRAWSERHALEAGLALYYETGARTLSMSGAPRRGIDVLTQQGTFYQAFHRMNAHSEVLAVRSASSEADDESGWTPGGVSRIWINGSLPAALELADLKRWVGTVLPIWKAPPAANLQRDTTASEYAELYLNGDDAHRMVALLEDRAALQVAWNEQPLDDKLDEWLLRDRHFFAEAEARPVPPSAAQLAYFDREILTPLVQLSESGYVRGKWSGSALAQLRAIHYVASGMGYAVTLLRDKRAKQQYLVLDEAAPRRFYRGRYVLRAGGGDDYAVNVPDPANEPNALEYGLTLFESLKARALLVAGAAHPDELAHSPAIVPAHMEQGVFALANQVLKRELGEAAFMIVISRGMAPGELAPADVSLALADGTMSRRDASPLATKLLKAVQRSGMTYDFREAAPQPMKNELAAIDEEIAILWLSPRATVAHAGSTNVRTVPASLQRKLRYRSSGADAV